MPSRKANPHPIVIRRFKSDFVGEVIVIKGEYITARMNLKTMGFVATDVRRTGEDGMLFAEGNLRGMTRHGAFRLLHGMVREERLTDRTGAPIEWEVEHLPAVTMPENH